MLIKIFNTGILDVNTYVLIDENTKESIIIDLGGNFEKITAGKGATEFKACGRTPVARCRLFALRRGIELKLFYNDCE